MSPSSIEIRKMKADDLDQVVAILQTIVQQNVTNVWSDELADQVDRASSCCLAAVDEGNVIGFIIANVTIGAFGADRTGWLGYIGVNPKYMGQGIGSELAEALFAIFAREGVKSILTACPWDSVDMLSFFKRLGFDRSEFINLSKRLG